MRPRSERNADKHVLYHFVCKGAMFSSIESQRGFLFQLFSNENTCTGWFAHPKTSILSADYKPAWLLQPQQTLHEQMYRLENYKEMKVPLYYIWYQDSKAGLTSTGKAIFWLLLWGFFIFFILLIIFTTPFYLTGFIKNPARFKFSQKTIKIEYLPVVVIIELFLLNSLHI